MSELEIPRRAQLVALQAYNSHDEAAHGLAAAMIAATRIVVAGELRRLAVPYGEREDICAGDRDLLLAHAQELDPQ